MVTVLEITMYITKCVSKSDNYADIPELLVTDRNLSVNPATDQQDFDGLRTSIIEMLSGSSVEVNVNEFQNDMVSFADKDDVLTLLIPPGLPCLRPENPESLYPQ